MLAKSGRDDALQIEPEILEAMLSWKDEDADGGDEGGEIGV